MSRSSIARVRVVISGRVQAVWYRGWTVDEAAVRGLDGWVRNRRDGTVEAVFQGAPAAVEDMIEACRQGPPAAHVINIERFEHEEPIPPGFRSWPTA